MSIQKLFKDIRISSQCPSHSKTNLSRSTLASQTWQNMKSERGRPCRGTMQPSHTKPWTEVSPSSHPPSNRCQQISGNLHRPAMLAIGSPNANKCESSALLYESKCAHWSRERKRERERERERDTYRERHKERERERGR